jgi:hypothetical protein
VRFMKHNIVELLFSIPLVVTAAGYFKDGEGEARPSAFRPKGDLQSSLVMASPRTTNSRCGSATPPAAAPPAR